MRQLCWRRRSRNSMPPAASLILQTRPASAGNRHRLGRSGHSRRAALRLPGDHHHHIRANSTNLPASAWRSAGLQTASRCCSRTTATCAASTMRWYRSKWSRRWATSTWTPISSAAAACCGRTAPCCCRPSPSATSSTTRRLRSVDFIKRYIFPGSFIPSVQVLIEVADARHRLEAAVIWRISVRTTPARLKAVAQNVLGTAGRKCAPWVTPDTLRAHVGVLSVLLRGRLRGAAVGRRADAVDQASIAARVHCHRPCPVRLDRATLR